MCRIIEEYGDEREAEGRQKTAIANAKNFLKKSNLSSEMIADCCSLPLEQVLALKKELEQQEETAF